MKLIDVNKATKSELKKYISNNAKVANQRLTQLERADLTHSKAYQYTQNKLANKSIMRVQNGNFRFKSRKSEIEKLSQSELRQLASQIQGYKQTRSGSVRGQKDIEKDIYNTFQKTATEQGIDVDISEDDFKKIVKSEAFKDMKEKYSSSTAFEFLGKYGVNEEVMQVLSEVKNDTIMELYEIAGKIFNEDKIE